MSYSIAKGSALFKYGMSDPAGLLNFMNETRPLIGIAFCGRSNVGKSSLINALFGKSTARSSKTPGRTREVNIFSFSLLDNNKPFITPHQLYLFDLPGYGHAEVSKEQLRLWQKLMGTFFECSPPSMLIVNMQDARHPHTDSDQLFNKYIKEFALPTSLIFNKIDKLKTQKERHALRMFQPELLKKYKWARDVHFVSAEKKDGIAQLEESIITFILKMTQGHG